MKDEEWARVIDTNLNSIFRLSKAVLRGMTKARWGRIVNISSVVGSMGNAGQANYAASKAGMEGFTRALAREIGSRAITVNCVAPGFIDTDMTRELPEAQRQKLLEQIPAGRLGEAERDRRRGGLPGLGCGGLYHRRDDSREWRHVHALKHFPFCQYCSNGAIRGRIAPRQRAIAGMGISVANGTLNHSQEQQIKMSSIEERVKKIVAEQLGVKEEDIQKSASFVEDLGADSLDTVELVMALEEEFETEIPDEDAENITTVQHAIDYVESHL